MGTPKIVQVCGANGAGKSYVVRKWIKGFKPSLVKPIFVPDRTLPLGYEIDGCFIVGAYEEANTGGVDSIKIGQEFCFELIEDRWREGYDVLFEGVLIMNHTRGLELWRQTKSLVVLELKVSTQDCLNSINERRAKVGKLAKEPKQLKSMVVRSRNYCIKLRQAGCEVLKVTRKEAVSALEKLLG